MLLITEGKPKEAEPFVREGLTLRRKVLGDAHPDTAASFLRVADLLYAEGDYTGAEQAAKESIAVFGRALAHPTEGLFSSSPLMRLGLIMNKTGRSREGESYLRQSLAIRIRLLAPGNQLIGAAQGALGECLTTQKRYAEAEPLLLESYRIFKSTAGEQDRYTRESHQRLKILYEAWHKPEKSALY